MPSADLILEYVNSHWKSLPKRPELDWKENNVAVAIIDILNSVEGGDMSIVTDNDLIVNDEEEDTDYDPSDEICNEDLFETADEPDEVLFLGAKIKRTLLQQAVEHYGSLQTKLNNGRRKRPSLETMTSKFRFITQKSHLDKLREIESKGEIIESRREQLKIISDTLAKEVKELMKTGSILHDSTLRYMTARIIKTNNMDILFKASKSWIAKFKNSHRISSRKITKFVTVKNHRDKAALIKKGEEYVHQVNQQMVHYLQNQIFSADQSGIQKELHTGRTLAETGSKKVECTVQSVASTTHSYTIMPVLSAEGKFHEKLFVVLQEPSGKFPAKGHYQADNLVVTCHTSHIMTKKLMLTFFEDLYFDASMPTNTLLLVDSWSSWKDKDAIDSVTPPTHKVETMIIPPGCTGDIQVLDVGIFYGFKKVIKIITGQLQFDRPNYKINRRDETLKMLSAVYRQICHPKLQPWAQYAWHKSGYQIPRPLSFSTPAQLLLHKDVAGDCSSSGCKETSFIQCLYCDKLLCIDHFLVEEVHEC